MSQIGWIITTLISVIFDLRNPCKKKKKGCPVKQLLSMPMKAQSTIIRGKMKKNLHSYLMLLCSQLHGF